MNEKKICYIDLETGNPHPENTTLIQLSGAIEINWVIQEKFDIFIKPFPGDPPIEQQASDKHGITADIIAENKDNKFVAPEVAYKMITDILNKYVKKFDKKDKFIFVGYNSHSFDFPVLRKFFEKNNDVYIGSYFWYPCVDVMLMYMADWYSIRDTIDNFQLQTIAKLKGIEIDETRLHDGLYDIQLTRELFIRREKEMHNLRSVYGQVQMELAKKQEEAKQSAQQQATPPIDTKIN